MISQTFDRLKAQGEGALIPFVMGGDPTLEALPGILDALVEGGADLIEIGLPFSDPIADGPTIQAAGHRALVGGASPKRVLETLAACKVPVPIVLMGYLNPMLRMGLREFAAAAAEAGASGVIVCDVIPSEAQEWMQAAGEARLDTIFLAAPTSTEDRLAAIAAASSGFVYAVSRTGVTGALESVPPEVEGLVGSLRRHTQLPVCVGFGISRPEHVRAVCQVADGAVVGSRLVDLIAKEGIGAIAPFIRALKEATRGV